jgi:phosphoglycerate dehydrogenase-like enzyme
MGEAIVAGGGHLVPADQAAGLIWANPRDPVKLAELLRDAPHIEWVQLPFAGVEDFVDLIDDDRLWTCGKGVYAEPVGRNLQGARVTVLGGGAITESLLRLLVPFDCHVTVVRNRAHPLEGADLVLEADQLSDALPGADVVFLALALTPDTEGIISADELSLMERHAWLVNVARGRHVVTDDLVMALRSNTIGGAGLDVTDPEPLPKEHPLWTLHNCLLTPHVGNTPRMARPLLARRIEENVRRFSEGQDLLGPVYVELGY